MIHRNVQNRVMRIKAAGSGVLLALALFAVACGGDDDGGGSGDASGELAIAYTVPQGDAPEDRGFPDLELRVHYGGEERTFEDGRWWAVNWAPDGSTLAALDLGEDAISSMEEPVEASVMLLDPASGDPAEVGVEGTFIGIDLVWAPDSSLLAVGGVSGVKLVTPDGEETATVEVEGARPILPAPGPFFESWSTDSQHLALATEDAVIVVDRNGETVARTERSMLEGLVDEHLGAAAQLPPQFPISGRWFDDSTLKLAVQAGAGGSSSRGPRPQSAALVGTLADGELSWEASDEFDYSFLPTPEPRPAWAQLGEGERFANGTFHGRDVYGRGVDTAWILYDPDGGQVLGADATAAANAAFVVHDEGETEIFEPDLDMRWFHGWQRGFPNDAVRIE